MKPSVKKFTSLLSKVSILGACVLQFPAYGAGSNGDNVKKAKPFVLEEATIKSIHAAFENKTLTCSALVKSYLARIEAYDKQGPSLHAIITVNPEALTTAAAMDRQYRDSKGRVGPLYCIPVILKDNYNTFDMPTSGGNLAMKNSVPPADAFTVAKMRKAGALILAKTNLQEFARRRIDQQPRRPGVEPVRPDPHAGRLQRRHRRGDRLQLRGAGNRQRYRPIR